MKAEGGASRGAIWLPVTRNLACRVSALEDTFACRLVEAQSFKNPRAHLDPAALACMSPFGKFDFGHQFRPDPVHAPRHRHPASERRPLGLNCL